MLQIQVNNIIKVRFGASSVSPKSAKVLAIKSGMSGAVLVEATDGSVMGTLLNADDSAETTLVYEADTMCPLGPTGYTREKAAKTLGFKNFK